MRAFFRGLAGILNRWQTASTIAVIRSAMIVGFATLAIALPLAPQTMQRKDEAGRRLQRSIVYGLHYRAAVKGAVNLNCVEARRVEGESARPAGRGKGRSSEANLRSH
jgi:hypothetical protein